VALIKPSFPKRVAAAQPATGDYESDVVQGVTKSPVTLTRATLFGKEGFCAFFRLFLL